MLLAHATTSLARRCPLMGAVGARKLMDARHLSSSSTDSVASSLFSPAQRKGGDKMAEKLQRGDGWREALRSGLREQEKEKRQDVNKEQMLHIAEMPEFTIDAFEGVLERGLKDLEESTNTGMARARLWADSMSGGVMSDTIEKQKEEAKRKLRIIREFNEHERRVPKLLDRRARKAIASTLDVSETEVSEVLFNFQLQHAQWTFLRRERLRGRPLPETSAELEWMVGRRPTKEFVAAMKAIREMRDRAENDRNEQAEEERKLA